MNWSQLLSGTISNYEGAVNDITNPISASSVADREYNANREDTQYQRLRKDLSAAGLNNWLAVNGSAQPSAQAISNTSEAGSRAQEIGFKYQQLLEDTLKFAEKQVQQGAEKATDHIWDLVKGIFTPRGISGLL